MTCVFESIGLELVNCSIIAVLQTGLHYKFSEIKLVFVMIAKNGGEGSNLIFDILMEPNLVKLTFEIMWLSKIPIVSFFYIALQCSEDLCV